MRRVISMYILMYVVIFISGKGLKGEENLLTNPSFEKEDPKGMPAGWYFMDCANRGEKGFIAEWSNDAHHGKHSVKIISKDATASAYWCQDVPVKPNTRYCATCYIKATKAKILLWLVGLDADLKVIRKPSLFDKKSYKEISTTNSSVLEGFVHKKFLSIIPPNQWGKISLIFTTRSDVHGISFRIGSCFKEGTMWFDDASLTEVK